MDNPSSLAPSPSLPPNNEFSKDNITRLMHEMARLQNKVATLKQQQQPEWQDPTIIIQVPYTTYHLTDDKAMQYPALKPDKPIDFFLKNKVTDTEFKDLFRKYPCSTHMGHYTAPKIPKVVTNNNSSFSKKHDNQICNFQECCTKLTQPIDFFLHKLFLLQE